MRKLKAVPVTQKRAAEFVKEMHRHHPPARGDLFRVGAQVDGKLVGIAQVGRPVARALDDGKTCEVIRLCTDGADNACSFLYARAARIAAAMGYERIITYILEEEPGTSLKAVGWEKEALVAGRSWSCKSRPREDHAPTCNKTRWAKSLK